MTWVGCPSGLRELGDIPWGSQVCRSRIQVTGTREDQRVRCSVRDEGIGIPAEMLEKAFDLLFQRPHALDRARGGLGLGLTRVRSLVEQHGGTVQAVSAGVGGGSEFIIDLPGWPGEA